MPRGLVVLALTLLGCGPIAAAPATSSPPTPNASEPPSPTSAPCPPQRRVTARERVRFLGAEEELGTTSAWRVSSTVLRPPAEPVMAVRSKADGTLALVARARFLTQTGKGEDGVLVGEDAVWLLAGSVPPKRVALSGVQRAQLSPDGSRAYAADDWGRVHRLDVATGRLERNVQLDATSFDDVVVGDDAVLVSSYPFWSILDPITLEIRGKPIPGRPSPGGRLLVVEDDEGLSLLDTRTAKASHRLRLRGSQVLAVGRDWVVLHGPRGELLVWEPTTGRLRRAQHADLGEADAESRRAIAVSGDGRYLCEAMDSEDGLFDLRTGTPVVAKPGQLARCAIDGDAWALRMPLEPHEVAVEIAGEGFGNHPDFVMDAERRRAAVLVTDERRLASTGWPLAMLVVDLATQRVLRRVELGTAHGGAAVFLTLDAMGRPRVRTETAQPLGHGVSIDWDRGEVTARALPEPPPRDLDDRALIEARGRTLLVTGRRGMTARRLDAPEKGHRQRDVAGCHSYLSPRGAQVLQRCPDDPQMTVLGLDGTSRKITPSTPPFAIRSLAVADDGSVALAGQGAIELHRRGTVTRLGGPGRSSALTFSPDGRWLAAAEPTEAQVVLWDRSSKRRAWRAPMKRAPTSMRFADGRLALGIGHDVLAAYDVERGTLLKVEAADRQRLMLGAAGAPRIVDYYRRRDYASGVRIGDLALVTQRERAMIYRKGGDHVATLFAGARGGLWATFADGRIEGLGATALPREAVCVDGEDLVDRARCDSLRDPGGLARVFRPCASDEGDAPR